MERIAGFFRAVISAIPQDLKFKDEDSIVEIGKKQPLENVQL